MKNTGILMRDPTTQEVTQIALDITHGKAHSLVVDLRSHKDGNYYWIGVLK